MSGLHHNRALKIGITLEIMQMWKENRPRRVVYTKIPCMWWLGEHMVRGEL